MLVLVQNKVRQQFLKLKNCPFKNDDFSMRGALDVKPIYLIWRIWLYTAAPYSGPPHLAKKKHYFLELSLH
jgi:hypothetical protein